MIPELESEATESVIAGSKVIPRRSSTYQEPTHSNSLSQAPLLPPRYEPQDPCLRDSLENQILPRSKIFLESPRGNPEEAVLFSPERLPEIAPKPRAQSVKDSEGLPFSGNYNLKRYSSPLAPQLSVQPSYLPSRNLPRPRGQHLGDFDEEQVFSRCGKENSDSIRSVDEPPQIFLQEVENDLEVEHPLDHIYKEYEEKKKFEMGRHSASNTSFQNVVSHGSMNNLPSLNNEVLSEEAVAQLKKLNRLFVILCVLVFVKVLLGYLGEEDLELEI